MQNYAGFNGYNNQFMPQYQHSQAQIQNNQGYRIIPISNKSETNSVIADFNGNPIYFHNQANNEIYIKQFDIKTGLAKLQEYKKVEIDNPIDNKEQANPYQDEFRLINERLEELKEMIKPQEKYVKK